MRKFGFLLTLFALMIFASDAYAQRGGGGRGGGGGPRGGGGQQGGGPRGGGQQMGQRGGGQCQQGGGGNQMRGGMGGGMGNQGTTPDTTEMVTQMLMRMDRNRDGMIASNEVPAQMQNQLSNADVNNDGILNRLEQMAVIDRTKILTGRPNATGIGLNAEIFQRLDRNQDNTISRSEVPRSLQRLFRTLDSNTDGSIDAEEQTAILERIKSKLNPEKPRNQKPAL